MSGSGTGNLNLNSQRGQGRGRGRGRGGRSRGRGGRGSAPPSSSALQATTGRRRRKDIMDGLLPNPLESPNLLIPALDGDEEDIRIQDFEHIGSYNWLDRPKPTILVPGELPECC